MSNQVQIQIKNKAVKIALPVIVLSIVLSFVYLEIIFINTLFPGLIFDKFIYRKSPWHGYNATTGHCLSWVNSDGYRDVEFYEKKPGEYLILVVGDSIVYGQGLLTSQRFSNKLQRMLNQIRPTKVFNLGRCGSNIYINYLAAKQFGEKLHPDLIVTTFYDNDLLVLDEKYDFPKNLSTTGNLIRDFMNIPSQTGRQYAKNVLGTYDESSDNWKMLTYLFPLLQKENVLYFFIYYDQSEVQGEEILKTYDLFRTEGLNAIHLSDFFKQKYAGQRLEISERELHPNSLANKMFTERLYQEITSNPKYGFIQN